MAAAMPWRKNPWPKPSFGQSEQVRWRPPQRPPASRKRMDPSVSRKRHHEERMREEPRRAKALLEQGSHTPVDSIVPPVVPRGCLLLFHSKDESGRRPAARDSESGRRGAPHGASTSKLGHRQLDALLDYSHLLSPDLLFALCNPTNAPISTPSQRGLRAGVVPWSSRSSPGHRRGPGQRRRPDSPP
jgi:hypothetical protein